MAERCGEQAAVIIACMRCVSLPVPGIRQTELSSRAQASTLNRRDAEGRARCVMIAGPVLGMIPAPPGLQEPKRSPWQTHRHLQPFRAP
jgi:hypothetical protein